MQNILTKESRPMFFLSCGKAVLFFTDLQLKKGFCTIAVFKERYVVFK